MTNFLTRIRPLFSANILAAIALGILAAAVPDVVLAQFYNGPGIVGGISHAESVGGVTGQNIRTVVLNLLLAVLLFMGLAAVVVIVIAGIYLVVSVGDESAKEKAKKIIMYAIFGLIIIALAAAIVSFVINATGGGSIFGDVPDIGAGSSTADLRATVLRILFAVLLFMGLAAVVVIVIAGIWMVVSLGDEGAKDRAKRIILYAIVGLIIIALAAAIVLFIIEATGAGDIFGPVPDLGGSGGTDIRSTVLGILRGVLAFMALIAVVVIVIAGIMLVVSMGDEGAKDRAKRIIFYAVIGLIIILLASALVGFISSLTT